jgi:hypothetical protein
MDFIFANLESFSKKVDQVSISFAFYWGRSNADF